MHSKILLAFVAAVASAAAGGDGGRLAIRSPSLQGSGIQARSISHLLFGRQSCRAGTVRCGSFCITAGFECCSFGGGCRPGTFCDVPGPGESGEPGCCEDGKDCSIGGGLIINTDTISGTTTIAAETSSEAPTETPTEAPTETSTKISVLVTAAFPTASSGGGIGFAPTNESMPTATAQPPPPPPQSPITGAAVEKGAPMAVVVFAVIAGLIGLV